MKKQFFHCPLAYCVIPHTSLKADVKLMNLFSSHMVLRRNQQIRICHLEVQGKDQLVVEDIRIGDR